MWRGAEIAKGLAAAGVHVLLNGRRADALDGVLAQMEAAGGSTARLVFNVADVAAAEAALARIEGRLHMRDRRSLAEFEDVQRMHVLFGQSRKLCDGGSRQRPAVSLFVEDLSFYGVGLPVPFFSMFCLSKSCILGSRS